MTERRLASLAVLAWLVLLGTRGRADVDLTGSWDLDVFSEHVVVEVVQSGPSLTIPPFGGTIDPATGTFRLEAPPSPGGFFPTGQPYGPSPPHTMNGAVDGDGNSFTATVVGWTIRVHPPIDSEHFPWSPYSYPISGVRRALANCGDGQLDEGEHCDDGSANGANDCCSTTCTVQDGDRDGFCDASDDCPTIYDPVQSCAVSLQVTSAHASSNGRARLEGTISHRIGYFSEVVVEVGGATRAYVTAGCTGNPANYIEVRCRDADGLLWLRAQRSSPLEDWIFHVRAKGLSIGAVPEAPLGVEIVDRSNGRMGNGEVTRCRSRGGRLYCMPSLSLGRLETSGQAAGRARPGIPRRIPPQS